MKKALILIIFQLLFLQITAENQIRDQFDILLQNNTNNIRSNKLDTSYKMFSFSNYKLFSALENNNRIDLDNNSIGLNIENSRYKSYLPISS